MLNQKLTGASSAANYIEDVFSTYLYTGTSASQTITNNIDLSTKGGLVWIKNRTTAYKHVLTDTARGVNKQLESNNTTAETTETNRLTAFTTSGFTVSSGDDVNSNTNAIASWTFRKQPKFFDVVTYTGTGATKTIAHSLTSTPGFVIVKRTDTTGGWIALHRQGYGGTWGFRRLDQTSAFLDVNSYPTYFGDGSSFVAPTSTDITVNVNADVNDSGGTYVAYLFAHDAGGFGLTGTDNVISCGSFTTDASGIATVNLGYEPQFILYKMSSSAQDWFVQDTMRGMPNPSSNAPVLNSNLSGAEYTDTKLYPTATGFYSGNACLSGSQTYIYIAIRRGPMKVPTDGTTVFDVGQNRTSIASQVNGTVGPMDMTMQTQVPTPVAGYHFTTFDRLRGASFINTSTTNGEAGGAVYFDTNVGVRNGTWFTSGGIWYNYKRAPSFFDEVCYTGNGATTGRTINHNLGVTPELMIVKDRSAGNQGWAVYDAFNGPTKMTMLAYTNASQTYTAPWNNTAPTSSVFTVNYDGAALLRQTNQNGVTFVAYLFATCPGVSKVGSYTGNGSSQTINCGFTAGARFILIKRTDSTGDWYIWDTVRGIVAGNDPHLSLNSASAEVTTDDSIDPDSSGFIVNQVSGIDVNVSSATYIYLAIA